MKRLSTIVLTVLAVLLLVIDPGSAQQPLAPFGGAYAGLDVRRQHLIDDWVVRFNQTTGQRAAAGPFYDELVPVSAKTTFDAVTHALMTTPLTDRAGASIGDALGLVERLDSVRGEITSASSDRQFRIYVRLVADAIDRLERSTQFKRGVDNAIYHKGYPINYRAQGGVPSLQFSIAPDRRHADIDVDYRSPSFPVSLFNGHLSKDNSDVRAGSNFDRHANRWSGLQSWWRGFFGVRRSGPDSQPAPDTTPLEPAKVPRVGNKAIDVMVKDFLDAWLIDGDIVAAMAYMSDRSYACLARGGDQLEFDRGLARFQLMVDMKAAHDTLGSRASLDGLVIGTRLATPALKLVRQPHHAQFVLYSVPDDVAAALDCQSESTLGDPAGARRAYGTYFGTTFVVSAFRDTPVTLLWARENGYWKIVSWKTGTDDASTPAPTAVAETKTVRVKADVTLVEASRRFLDSWLVRKDYDTAFAYLSPRSYACYNLEKDAAAPPATSDEEAGRRIRAGLEAAGKTLGNARSLDAIIAAAEPAHPAVQIMTHPYARTIGLSQMPTALADAAECAPRPGVEVVPDPLPLEYGVGFSATIRFKTRSGDAPVLRMLWRRDPTDWRITSYSIELP